MASRKSLIQRKGALDATHEILERLEAHLRAVGQFTVRILFFSAMRNLILRATLFSHYIVFTLILAGNCKHERK